MNSEDKFYRMYIWRIYEDMADLKADNPIRVVYSCAKSVAEAREKVVEVFLKGVASDSRREYMREIWDNNPYTSWFYKFLLEGAYEELPLSDATFIHDFED